MVSERFIEGQATKGYFARPEKVRSVSFTESNLRDLGKLISRRSEFGICFEKNLVDPKGRKIKPVHYLSREQVDAIKYQRYYPKGLDDKDRYWIDLDERGTYSFSWEREWRKLGDLSFEYEAVVFLLVPEYFAQNIRDSFGLNIIPSSAVRNPAPHMERISRLIKETRSKAHKLSEMEVKEEYLRKLAQRCSEFIDSPTYFERIAEMREYREREIFTEWGELRDADGEDNFFEAAMFDLDNRLDRILEMEREIEEEE